MWNIYIHTGVMYIYVTFQYKICLLQSIGTSFLV